MEPRGTPSMAERRHTGETRDQFIDLEAQMEHMESLIQGHFDEKPDRAMTRAEWDAIASDSAKKASDA